LIAQRQQDLADQAFAKGRLVLSERSKARVKRLHGYWDGWTGGDVGPSALLVKA
jgi:hypothetical protein